MKYNKTYVCKQCQKKFDDKHTLDRHLLVTHYTTHLSAKHEFNKHLKTDINLLSTFYSLTPRLLLDTSIQSTHDENDPTINENDLTTLMDLLNTYYTLPNNVNVQHTPMLDDIPNTW